MKQFALLFDKLDSQNSSSSKKQVLTEYLSTAEENHAAWIIYLLSGRKALAC